MRSRYAEWDNLLMSTNLAYAIDIQPVGDHLQVTIPELGIVLEDSTGQDQT